MSISACSAARALATGRFCIHGSTSMSSRCPGTTPVSRGQRDIAFVPTRPDRPFSSGWHDRFRSRRRHARDRVGDQPLLRMEEVAVVATIAPVQVRALERLRWSWRIAGPTRYPPAEDLLWCGREPTCPAASASLSEPKIRRRPTAASAARDRIWSPSMSHHGLGLVHGR